MQPKCLITCLPAAKTTIYQIDGGLYIVVCEYFTHESLFVLRCGGTEGGREDKESHEGSLHIGRYIQGAERGRDAGKACQLPTIVEKCCTLSWLPVNLNIHSQQTSIFK